MLKLDEIDRKILTQLQENCRITVKELSENLGLSPTPIFERIKKMENAGLITQYVALLDQKMLNLGLTAFLHVAIKDHSRAALDEFLDKITAYPEVMECHHVTGDFDFIIKVVTEDMESYNEFILQKLSIVPHLGKVQSQFSLSVRKDTTAFELLSE
jgi:DNA-binding Lrp family transcriptional regulator